MKWVYNYVVRWQNFTPTTSTLLNLAIIKIWQRRAPCRCHSTKSLINFYHFFDIILTTFRWLPFKLAYQIVWTVRCGDVNTYCQNANMELDISASHSSCILIGQLKRKPSESCQKDVKKLWKIGPLHNTVTWPCQS